MQSTSPGTSDWRFLWRELRPIRFAQMVSIALMTGATILSLVDPLILRWIIDTGLTAPDQSRVVLAVALFLVVLTTRFALQYAGSLLSLRAIQLVMLRLRLRLLRRVHAMDGEFHDRHKQGDLLYRLEQDIDQIGHVSADLFPNAVRIATSGLATLVIMGWLDWKLTAVTLPLVPLLLVLRTRARVRLEAASGTARETAGGRSTLLGESLAAGWQVPLLRTEHFFRARFADRAVAACRAQIGQRRSELAYVAGTFALVTLTSAVFLLLGAYQVRQSNLTVGEYVAFYSYLMRLFDPVSAAVDAYTALKRSTGSIRNIRELDDARAAVRQPVAPVAPPARVHDVIVRGIRFSYPDREPVACGMDLRIHRGERVAIVGHSGAGKSTLAKLLVRLYDVQGGSILLGGTDIRQIQLERLREAVTYVSSQPILFGGSLRENVVLGLRNVDDGRLAELARISRLDSLIQKLPEGWASRVGPGGIGLSDGERQRVGILRGLLRDRPVLILDEATGALDPTVERELLDALTPHVADKAVLVITHRMETAGWADRTLRLSNGVLQEERDGRPGARQAVLAGPITIAHSAS